MYHEFLKMTPMAISPFVGRIPPDRKVLKGFDFRRKDVYSELIKRLSICGFHEAQIFTNADVKADGTPSKKGQTKSPEVLVVATQYNVKQIRLFSDAWKTTEQNAWAIARYLKKKKAIDALNVREK